MISAPEFEIYLDFEFCRLNFLLKIRKKTSGNHLIKIRCYTRSRNLIFPIAPSLKGVVKINLLPLGLGANKLRSNSINYKVV